MKEEKDQKDTQKIQEVRSEEVQTAGKNTPIVSRNRVIESWEAEEYVTHEKDKRWYMIAGGITLFFILYGILTNSASMAIAFLLLAMVYYVFQLQQAKKVHVILSELGIQFGPRFYPYNTIQSFWILYNPPHLTTLNLKLTKGIDRHIIIQLGAEVNPGDLREYLLTQIPELEGQEETFTDSIIRKFKI
jgi:hypothetical protein